jgi:hypothetical protein
MAHLSIYLNAEGQERLALGQPRYSWHYDVRNVEEDIPEGHAFLGTVDAQLPTIAECLPPVLAKLKKREAEIQAEAYQEVLEIQERRNNLISLTYDPAREAE